jgi:predicted nucleic acid-binding protein
MIPATFRVVLDACILYPFTLRDVLLQAAAVDFYQVYWSETILDEALRNLIADGRMTEANAARLVAAMRRAFPEAQVTDYEGLIPSMRNDPKDRHVAAAAVKAGAQVIVTSNTRDFYDLPSGLEVQKPDEFLSNLFDLDPPRMMDVFHLLARRYKKPPMEIGRILDALALREIGGLVRTRLAEPNDS